MSLGPLVGLIAGVVLAGGESDQKPAAAATYLQLISSRPADRNVPRQAGVFDFVDKAKLPAGAKVLSAAKSAGGAIWVVTDRGAFRSLKDQYVPLDAGPRRLEPGQPHVPAGLRVSAVASDRLGPAVLAGGVSWLFSQVDPTKWQTGSEPANSKKTSIFFQIPANDPDASCV